MQWTQPRNVVIAMTVLVTAFSSVVVARIATTAGSSPQDQPRPLPEPVVEMRHHFVEVTRLHEAVIRGDLPEAKSAAARMAEMELPAGFATTGARFIGNIRVAARRAAAAPDLAAAASATAQMLAECGACHLTSVRPPIASPSVRDLGGIVGHMRDHQRSMDEMLQGLVVPSARLWSQGAERLRSEPLSTDRLPRDPDLTARVAQAETRVHQLADRAMQADETTARTTAYAQLLTTCAECHSLHGRIWGPRTPATGAGS